MSAACGVREEAACGVREDSRAALEEGCGVIESVETVVAACLGVVVFGGGGTSGESFDGSAFSDGDALASRIASESTDAACATVFCVISLVERR